MIKTEEKRQKASASVNREPFTDSLITFIRDELVGGSGVTLDADTYLFEQGVIDSLKILRLIAFVEHWMGSVIPDSEIVMANFRSVRTIATHFTLPQHVSLRKQHEEHEGHEDF